VRRVVIVHGYAATPTDHWFPWLAEQLRALGIHTAAADLPDPQAPERSAWLAATAAAIEAAGGLDEHTHLIAHSLGCITVLRHLAALPPEPAPTDPARTASWRLGGLTLVAGFTGPLPALPQLDGYLTDPPTDHPADSATATGASGGTEVSPGLDDVALQRIAARTTRLHVLRSDADAYVPATATDALAARLGTTAHVVPGAGHFLAEDGIITLPTVLETITSAATPAAAP
jgi:predicted alpha/beta hydrolase family esterase